MIIAGGSLITKSSAVVHPLMSVTVIEYEPAHKFGKIFVGEAHE